MMVSSEAREVITSLPSLLVTNFALCSFTEPLFLAWMLFSAAAVDAAPPMWNVRIVSCVPGSPIDCAAITPTASPWFTK
ncbi:Uncharacterised protein [Vibrio cholerae]|nr:Uncharacterised protein [Vibrio cholerae]